MSVDNKSAAAGEDLAINSNDTGLIKAIQNNAGAGLEDAPSMRIPSIRILQPTDERLLDDKHTLHGTEPGTIIEGETEEIIPSLVFIPVRVREAYYERSGHKRGEGDLMHIWDSRPRGVQWDAKLGLLRGQTSHYVQTHIYLGLYALNASQLAPARLDFRGSSLPTARTWLAQLTKPLQASSGEVLGQPPIYMHSWQFQTSKQTKDKHVWYAFDAPVRRAILHPDREHYNLARLASEQGKQYFAQLFAMKAGTSQSDIDDKMPF